MKVWGFSQVAPIDIQELKQKKPAIPRINIWMKIGYAVTAAKSIIFTNISQSGWGIWKIWGVKILLFTQTLHNKGRRTVALLRPLLCNVWV